MSKSNTKSAAVVTEVPALRKHVTALKAAYAGQIKWTAKVAEVIVAAGRDMSVEQVESFISMIEPVLAQFIAAPSVKVEKTRIRGVLKAAASGHDFKAESLRGMYEETKGTAEDGKGGRKTGAKLPNPAEDAEDADKPEATIVTLTKAEKKALDVNAAITLLFGTCTPELLAAVEYAVSQSGLFMSWASSSVKAAQLAELEKLAAQKPAIVPKAAPVAKRATRQRKAA